MADDIDMALQSLSLQALPGGLSGLEARVMARIDAEIAGRLSRPSFGVGAGIAVAALVIGFSTATMPAGADTAPLELSVFSANAALAPATLLTTAR